MISVAFIYRRFTMKKNKILPILLAILVLVGYFIFGGSDSDNLSAEVTQQPGTVSAAVAPTDTPASPTAEADTASDTTTIDESGSYTTKEDVALYIHTYGHLPDNFVTKAEATAAGWSGGSLEKYLPGKCIGGDRFGNYEGLLPSASGRTYKECDINTLGAGSRGAERIIFSNDGLIYYTGDHYDSFELLYD
jgi:guanyl-specific ribonuclease Sa